MSIALSINFHKDTLHPEVILNSDNGMQTRKHVSLHALEEILFAKSDTNTNSIVYSTGILNQLYGYKAINYYSNGDHEFLYVYPGYNGFITLKDKPLKTCHTESSLFFCGMERSDWARCTKQVSTCDVRHSISPTIPSIGERVVNHEFKIKVKVPPLLIYNKGKLITNVYFYPINPDDIDNRDETFTKAGLYVGNALFNIHSSSNVCLGDNYHKYKWNECDAFITNFLQNTIFNFDLSPTLPVRFVDTKTTDTINLRNLSDNHCSIYTWLFRHYDYDTMDNIVLEHTDEIQYNNPIKDVLRKFIFEEGKPK